MTRTDVRSIYSGEVLDDGNWQYVCMACERRFHYDWVKQVALELPHKECDIDRPFHRHARKHWHPPGREYATHWLPDPRYPNNG